MTTTALRRSESSAPLSAAQPAQRHRCVQLVDRFELESGTVLRDVRQAYHLDGTLNAERDNLIIVFHALTGSSDAVGEWWREVAGPGLAIDTDRYAVLCTNLLGSCYGTTGPSDDPAHEFPEVTTRDMARLVGHLVSSLHVSSVALAIGGSLGGMVALEFAATFPQRARRIVALAAPAEHPAAAIGWSHLQRSALALGNHDGLELARMIAMMSYRTAGELDGRFGRTASQEGGYAVTRYLSRHGEKLRERFDAATYRTLLGAMDSHDVGRHRGGIAAALRPVHQQIVGVGIPGDLLYDASDVRRWTSLSGSSYREIRSANGHDGFLTESAQVSALIADVLSDTDAIADVPRGVAPAADVIILGYGRVGRELARQLSELGDATAVRIVCVVDSTGYLLDADGLDIDRIQHTSRAKDAGTPLAEQDTGVRGDAASVIARLARRTLTRPIVVDATANEVSDVLVQALAAQMDVVLANKRPLTHSLLTAAPLPVVAARLGRRLRHEATVGAGLPVVDTIAKLQESGDEILAITCCPSGTLGYLFGEMGRGVAFSDAIRRAHDLGYTEPDPREDLSGLDVARKALILGRLIGFTGDIGDVTVESLVPPALRSLDPQHFLDRVSSIDDEWRARVGVAREAGQVLRYCASITPSSVRVGLELVAAGSALGTLTGTNNHFALTTRRYGADPIVIIGPGAGIAVTAAGVLNDVLAIARAR